MLTIINRLNTNHNIPKILNMDYIKNITADTPKKSKWGGKSCTIRVY